MDSPIYDRNPSPPPEIVEHSELITAESIGNTAFSKHWLFSTLMKLIEEVDKENQGDDSEGDDSGPVNIDDELQNELCKLWDMSMNSEVAVFLNEFKAVEILTEVIEKSKAPRVTEICVGILGNMACEQTACTAMSESQKLIDLMLAMMENRDTPTLVENTRLIYTSLSNSSTRAPWIRAIQRSEDVLGHLMFIFSSSTNCDLLKNTAELVDVLLDLENDLCVSWATVDFIHSLLEATEQIGSNHSEALEVYLHIFQSFSTTESGVEALVEHGQRLTKKIMKYLNIVCEYEIVGIDEKEESLTSALSVLNILIESLSPAELGDLYCTEKLIRIILKILEPLYPMLQGYRTENQSETSQSATEPIESEQIDQVTSSDQSQTRTVKVDTEANTDIVSSTKVTAGKTGAVTNSEKDKEHRLLEILYEILSGLLISYCSIVFKEPSDNKENQRETTQCQVTENNPDSTSESMAKGDNSCNTKGDNHKSDSSEVTLSKGDNLEMADSKSDSDQTGSLDITDQSEVTEQSSVKFGVDCLPILTYFEEACSRCRINYFSLCLRETEKGVTLFEAIYSHAKSNSKDRLCRILNDVVEGKIINRADSGKCEET